MSLLRRKSSDPTPAPEAAAPTPVDPAPVIPGMTPGKGRPTPKRSAAQGRRGPVPPPPKTQREAMRRAKTSPTGKKLTKEERRALAAERRERMARGDDAYVLPRDRGPVRAYVRDLVDARRNIAGLLLPFALVSIVILLIPVQIVQVYGPLLLFVAILAAVVDAFFFGKQISRKVAQKFPKGDPNGMSTKGSALGFYAFNRAVLFRRLRTPRPRVDIGTVVD